MKTICTKIDNKSIHLFDDDYILEEKDNNIFIFDGNKNLLLSISNSSLYTTYENIQAPIFWCPKKYRYSPSFGWVPSKDWTFPYNPVFDTLHNKYLQLVQCLHDKSIIDNDDLLMLRETKTLEKSIKEYKEKYEGSM